MENDMKKRIEIINKRSESTNKDVHRRHKFNARLYVCMRMTVTGCNSMKKQKIVLHLENTAFK